MIVPRVVPFAAFIALLAMQPLLEGRVDARWLVVGRGLVAGALLLVFWRAYVELREAPRTSAGDWAVALGGGAAVAVLWVLLDAPWASFGGVGKGFAPLRPDGTPDAVLIGLRLAGFVLVVPIIEELFWRSFLMRWIDRRDFLALDPRRASALAVIVTSALFAVEHSQWVAGLAAGLVYGMIYRRTGNLRASVASHAVSNLLLGAWVLEKQQWSLW